MKDSILNADNTALLLLPGTGSADNSYYFIIYCHTIVRHSHIVSVGPLLNILPSSGKVQDQCFQVGVGDKIDLKKPPT